jgi:hypothetical protein
MSYSYGSRFNAFAAEYASTAAYGLTLIFNVNAQVIRWRCHMVKR